jgi:hypothetical protein
MDKDAVANNLSVKRCTALTLIHSELPLVMHSVHVAQQADHRHIMLVILVHRNETSATNDSPMTAYI